MASTADASAPQPPPFLHARVMSEATTARAMAKLDQKQPLFARFRRKDNKQPDDENDNESEHSQTPLPPARQESELTVPVIAVNDSAALDATTAAGAAASASSSALSLKPSEGDQYSWVTVFEHQRGVTLLGGQYYSSVSLFPWDPPPFLVPKTDRRVGAQTMQSLDDFVLPDPSWRWVSRAWMVDMRSDGAVQYDGFEYNWHFRKGKWRPRVGFMSSGGYVRRRRWVRLMVRPTPDADEPTSSHPDSIISSPTGASSSADLDELWRGDEDDWRRVFAKLKRSTRDGTKLELWRSWLGVRVEHDRRKAWTEDREDVTDASPFGVEAQDANPPVPRDWLITVLREHGRDILHFFIFPDSRAQFLDLLFRANLRDQLSDSGIFDGVDFYSRSPSLTTSPSSPSPRKSSNMVTILDSGEPQTAEPQGYDMRAFEKEQAAVALDAIEVGRTGDGSNANFLDKGKKGSTSD